MYWKTFSQASNDQAIGTIHSLPDADWTIVEIILRTKFQLKREHRMYCIYVYIWYIYTSHGYTRKTV